MKNLLLFHVILGCGVMLVAGSAAPCCKNNEIMRPKGYCGNETSRVNLNCTLGHMLLEEVILRGDKVSTKDSPSFTFVEDPKQYCLGQMYRNASLPELGVMPVAVVCFQELAKYNEQGTGGILVLISVFFFVITFGVYMYLQQLRDLQGLCYICLCISMALGYLSLAMLQLSPKFLGVMCTVTGFMVYVWMMATFFWMNVICINVYRTIIDASYLKKTARNQFFLYSCYAWGGPLFFLTVALIANFSEGDHYKPDITLGYCWFRDPTSTWIFFYGPVAVLIATNIVLFVLSSVNLWRHTRNYEVNKLNNLKYKFLLSLKLFLVMGISWIFEILSFAHGESNIIWRIMDAFNSLQGVVIFILLVLLRKRAMLGLAKENCCLPFTQILADKLNHHDDSDDQQMLGDDAMDVRLN